MILVIFGFLNMAIQTCLEIAIWFRPHFEMIVRKNFHFFLLYIFPFKFLHFTTFAKRVFYFGMCVIVLCSRFFGLSNVPRTLNYGQDDECIKIKLKREKITHTVFVHFSFQNDAMSNIKMTQCDGIATSRKSSVKSMSNVIGDLLISLDDRRTTACVNAIELLNRLCDQSIVICKCD